MEKSAIIIKSENGSVTYVVGEVVTKTKEQLEADVKNLEAERAAICDVDLDSIKQEYEAKLEELKAKYEKDLADAQACVEENHARVARINEDIDNLNAVLATISPNSYTPVETQEVL